MTAIGFVILEGYDCFDSRERQEKQKIIDQLDETGLQIARILTQEKCYQNKDFNEQTLHKFTKQQILDILSLQKNVIIIDEKIFVNNKKKRGGKLDIKKFSQKFSSKN